MVDVTGIDVSHHQGAIAWDQVRDVAFVYMKASEGTTFVDPRFNANRIGCSADGLLFGCYHFGHPRNDPQVEARHFLTTVGGSLGQLPLCLDLETSDGTPNTHVQAWAQAFLDRVGASSARRPMLYTGLSFFQNVLGSRDFGASRWIAAYRSTPPPIPHDVWQYTSDGRVPGIAGRVDMNRTTRATLVRLVGREPAPSGDQDMTAEEHQTLINVAQAIARLELHVQEVQNDLAVVKTKVEKLEKRRGPL